MTRIKVSFPFAVPEGLVYHGWGTSQRVVGMVAAGCRLHLSVCLLWLASGKTKTPEHLQTVPQSGDHMFTYMSQPWAFLLHTITALAELRDFRYSLKPFEKVIFCVIPFTQLHWNDEMIEARKRSGFVGSVMGWEGTQRGILDSTHANIIGEPRHLCIAGFSAGSRQCELTVAFAQIWTNILAKLSAKLNYAFIRRL